MNQPKALHRAVERRIVGWSAMTIALLVLTTPAWAHHLPPSFEDIDEFEQAQMVSGLLHPFTGLDHLLLALAMGWVAFAAGVRRGVILACSFLASIALGMVAGRQDAGLPMLEQGIALSVMVGGLMLAYASKRVPYSGLLLAVFAGLWHGNAHGAEMPMAASAWEYGAALVAGTGAILSVGAGLAALFALREEPMGRWIGAGVTAAGVWLWLA